MLMMWQRIKKLIQQQFPPKQKRAIEDWDFIMIFESRYKLQIRTYFDKIKQTGITNFQFFDNEDAQQALVLIQLSETVVIDQAHDLKILKKKNKKSYLFDLKTLNKEIFIAQDEKNENYCNYLKFIRARLLPQNKNIYEQQKYSVFNKQKIDKYQKLPDNKLFTPEEQLRAKYHFLLNYRQELAHQTIVQDCYIYPFTQIMKHAGFKQLQPIHKRSKYGTFIFEDVKDYVGSNTQTYFDFIDFMQKWLVFPMIIGLLAIAANHYGQYTADDSPADFIYAFCVMVWSILFITKWENNQKWHKAIEQSGYSDQWSQHQNIVNKAGFSVKQSRVNGQKQYYVPVFKKFLFYFISIFVCITILLLTLIFMVLSLNARGFIDQSHKLLYFESISNLAKPGGIFDSETNMGQIPNIIHAIVTNVFDQMIYRRLVKKFTKLQKHINHKNYENSIILKFFIYEYIITFADMFYIAFVRMDIIGLREQLLSLFFIDIIRRLVAELVIPKIKGAYLTFALKRTKNVRLRDSLKLQAIVEVSKEQYQPFDQYLEIVTNFAYLVMISSCFPLAPALIMVAHAIEQLQDKYKIIHIFKRKLPIKYAGMGYWNKIMVFICYSSIVTNILLFAFSSHQIASFFPQMFEKGKNLLLGNSQISDIMGQAAMKILGGIQSVLDSTMGQNIANSIIEKASNLTSPIPSPFPIIQTFVPPAEEHQTQFITILFIIEHVFLLLFLFLRNIISKQESQADILIKRREAKRKIKKNLQKDILSANQIRDHFVKTLFSQEKDAPSPLFGIFAGMASGNLQVSQKENESTVVEEPSSILAKLTPTISILEQKQGKNE